MVSSNTLLIKHLPNILDNSEKEDFLRHFGAKEVKCITSKCNKYNVAFAKFENEQVAENVMHRLHQVSILGSCLSVEFAKQGRINSAPPQQNQKFFDTKEVEENEKYYKLFIEKLSSWHSDINFKQPIPSHLKYQYPPPNMQTLVNILKVLSTVPKFYTQVLHLMNKMNLPCPFGKDILPEIELDFLPSKKEEEKNPETLAVEPEKAQTAEDTVETSESEISSDEESKRYKETIPEQHIVRKKTKIKVPKFFKPVPAVEKPKNVKKTSFEEVFEKVADEKESKRIKLSHPITLSETVSKTVEKPSVTPDAAASGFGYIRPVNKKPEEEPPKDVRDEREEERLEKEEIHCISEADLAENRISEKDRSVLPVFKNYAEGAPTCRLYIKNIAKTVTDQDLRYIYSRYLSKNIEDEPNMFDIRLMQEGRMKGQAFVTLQTVELAQKALKETNGYILKEKPLVVQFARSATK